MNDTPTSAELLDAVAELLVEQVLPETTGTTRHAVRVAANLCRIVGRDVVESPDRAEIDSGLAALLGSPPSDDLGRLLDERLQSDDPDFDASVADLLFADVCRRVDIAKPGYRKAGE